MILNYAFAVVIVALICGHDAISSDQPSSMDNFAVGSRTQMNEQINKDLLRDIINQYLKKVHNTPQETVAIKTGKELVTSSGNVKTLNLKMTKPQSPGVFQAPNAAAADVTAKASSLRPMHLRTIGLRDNQLEKVKTLNAQAQKSNEATKKLSFSSEANLAGTNNLAAYHPHHQQYYHGHAQHYNPQFDQSMMYQNQFAMPNQAQQYNQALMGQQQQQQQQYSADSSNTYFQSASFGNNRKNNELKKARKEMITDSDFLRDNPKLGHFLYIKYMKEASNSPGDNDLPNKESLPKGPAKFKSIKQQQDKEKEKEKKKSKDEETRTSKKKQPVDTKKVDEEKTAEIEKNKQSIIEKKESEEIKNNKSGEKKDEEKVGEEKRDGVKDKKLIDEETLKKITAKFAAKDSKSKNVFLVDADDLANYLSNMKIEN